MDYSHVSLDSHLPFYSSFKMIWSILTENWQIFCNVRFYLHLVHGTVQRKKKNINNEEWIIGGAT